MKYTIVGLFLLILPGTAIAQQQTGFSDPDDIHQLLDYRLPDWGYSNFLLDISSGGTFLNRLNKRMGEDLEQERRRINFLITPGYELYRESERRIFELNSNIAFDYRNRRDKFSGDNSIEEDRRYNSELNITAELREYISPDLFLLGTEDIDFLYNTSFQEEQLEGSVATDREELQRVLSSDTRLGIGFGRVRNVGPVIRALRLKERYGVLANGKQLDNGEVAEAADVFTRYDGYQQRYDRPEKYFWQAMDETANGSFSKLSPFDILYLTDVLNENIGRRLEGWELAGGGVFNYSNDLSRTEQSVETLSFRRSLNIQKNAGIFVEGRWFKNLSLNHQIGFSVNGNRTYPISSNTSTQWNTSVRAELSWLWNMADRFLTDIRLINYYGTAKREADEYFDERRSWYNNSYLVSNFTYFIENRLAFNISVRYSLNYNSLNMSQELYDERNRQLSFSAGIQYYFSRNLY